MFLFRTFLVSLLIGIIGPGYAVTVNPSTTSYNLLKEVQIFVDKEGNANSQDVINHPEKFDFKSTAFQNSEINFGFSKAIYWVKIPLSRSTTAPAEWVLEIPYLGLDKISFYAPNKPEVISGSLAPMQDRAFYYRFFSFPITLSNETQNYFLKIESSYAITIPLMLFSLAEFNNEQVGDTLIQAL